MSNLPHMPNLHGLPEVVGEIIGWRTWNVKRLGVGSKWRLRSLGTGAPHYSCLWTPGTMLEAICDRCDGTPRPSCSKSRDGTQPGEWCTCGFYAAASREHLAAMPYPKYNDADTVRVYGRVAMAGKVIPGSQGWRAQYVWPVEVWVPNERPELVAALSDAYNIPVHLGNLVYTRHKQSA